MTKIAALEARIDLLSLALQEMGRALAPAQASAVADAIRSRLADKLALCPPEIDEAVVSDLAPLLQALGRCR